MRLHVSKIIPDKYNCPVFAFARIQAPYAVAQKLLTPQDFLACIVSATPQQSEICVKSSVFHTVFGVKIW